MPEKPVCFDTQQTTVSPHVVIAMYQEFRPDRRLAPWVECGWTRSGSAIRSLRVMPDGCVDLFVSSRGDVMIAGAATTFYDLRRIRMCSPVFDCGQARLPPSWWPVSEFTDQQVLLDSILGVRDFLMAEKVLAATTPSQRVAALQNVLTGYLADTDPLIDTAVTRAIGMMRRHPDRPVSSLAVAVDLSERQLRRRFETAVGYGPKRFGRILRFQRLLDLIIPAARIRWAEFAVRPTTPPAAMINECLALAGMSPIASRGVSVSSIRPRVIRLSLCRMTDPESYCARVFPADRDRRG
jgi:methylphosphotriester-DNA--protein-cysteine methyltransferase